MAIVAPPIAGEHAHARPQLLGTGKHVEALTTPASDTRRPQLAVTKETEHHRMAVGTDRVERAAHHRLGRRRHALEARRPALDRALVHHLADDLYDEQRLGRDVVLALEPRSEALHHVLERAGSSCKRPARVVRLRELGERNRPRATRIEPPRAGMQELSQLPILVDGDHPSAWARGLAIGRCAGFP